MNLKVLGLIAAGSLLFTILAFVLTARKPAGQTPATGESPTPALTLIPTLDPQQPPSEGKAKITGYVCPLTTGNLDQGVTVVAEKIPSRERFTFYIQGPITQDTVYAMEIDPGTYEVYSEIANRRKLGLYSKYVLCGLDPERCLDHALLQFEIPQGQLLTDVDVCDYDWFK